MKPLFAALLSAVLLAETSRVSRVSLAAMEKSMDTRIQRLVPEDPYELLGATRGMYVEDYGAVFSFEVDLVAGAALNPFSRPSYSKDDLTKLKQKKQQRLFQLKQSMREMMMSSAASLDGVPPEQQIVVGALILYYSWEDSSGLPRQIVMQAQKKALVGAAKGNSSSLEAALRVQEF